MRYLGKCCPAFIFAKKIVKKHKLYKVYIKTMYENIILVIN